MFILWRFLLLLREFSFLDKHHLREMLLTLVDFKHALRIEMIASVSSGN